MIEVNYNEYKETIAQNMKLIVENHDLKQEIERLNKCYCNRSDCAGRLNQKNEVYDSVVQRNEKAIDYIEQQRDTKTHRLDTRLERVSKILQGVDKE